MLVRENVSLRNYNTFGIDAQAKRFCSITSVNNLKEVLGKNSVNPLFILGGGSNMLLTKDIDALVLHIDIRGIEVIEESDDYVIVKAMAGENWHNFVMWSIANNYGGIENLSLIPGNVGTAPIQNIGAYGVELKDVFMNCEAVNLESHSIRSFSLEECKFGYRDSIFKNDLKNKVIITSVSFKLTKTNHKLNMDYGAIKQQLDEEGVKKPTIRDISDAVIEIRQSKLPDPKEIGNSGSFFKNPVILKTQFTELQKNFPDIPSYKVSETEVKVPAGWLIEKAGFKGKQFGNYGVHKKQALVLVNYGGAKGNDIFKLAQLIQKTINQLFGIDIETEVNII